ncbi:membrane hypothetical protein [groundwater metagenome]|uniref:Uncharacterized protein n=2 Tax=groundwater metagenome TaxID=717931 RepID=A0A098E8C1_9ZZZZ
MEFIDFMAGYAILAIVLFGVGIIYKFGKTFWNRATMRREMSPKTYTIHPIKKRSVLEALYIVNVLTFTKFWAKANMPTFMAHLLYHVAIGTAILTYTLSGITLLMTGKIWTLSLPDMLVYVFDWFTKFHSTEGYALLNSAIFTQVMIYLFMIAVVLGILAELTTLTLSVLNKRGMISPIDEPTKMANIRTSGLPRSTKGGYQRKIIGLMVLAIVGSLFLQFVGVLDEEIAFYIHGTVALTFIAILPYTMLFHEIARWRMCTGVKRMMNRTTA